MRIENGKAVKEVVECRNCDGSGEQKVMTKEQKKAQLQERLVECRNYEKKTGERCYVLWSMPMNCYLTSSRMPLMGEWYDSDGVRHA